MNFGRLIESLIRSTLNRFLHRGIDAGVKRMAGGGKSEQDQSPEDRAQARAARETAKRARQAARLARRTLR